MLLMARVEEEIAPDSQNKFSNIRRWVKYSHRKPLSDPMH
jgi:hypothetical protein